MPLAGLCRIGLWHDLRSRNSHLEMIVCASDSSVLGPQIASDRIEPGLPTLLAVRSPTDPIERRLFR
jgi:hypothetical protein